MNLEFDASTPPIQTAHLFPILDEKLIQLLKGLNLEEWYMPTIAGKWQVIDIAYHLLDSNVRALSALRDGYFGPGPGKINSYEELVHYLNQLNADWIQAMKRMSPAMLIDLLAHTGQQCHTLWSELPPFEPAIFSVAWAGEEESQNWFHMAREYTEKWHHQQQIRLAVGKADELYTPELYIPHLETSMRALPHHYQIVEAPEGTILEFTITLSTQHSWFLQKNTEGWHLITPPNTSPNCSVDIPHDIAWRVFTKGISPEKAEPLIQIQGNATLGKHILKMLAVMA